MTSVSHEMVSVSVKSGGDFNGDGDGDDDEEHCLICVLCKTNNLLFEMRYTE